MSFKLATRFLTLASCLLAVTYLTGCASAGNHQALNPQDPYEKYNRVVFKFNLGVDKAVYRPIATVYNKVVPAPVDKGVTNFFNNIDQVPDVANDLLQANVQWALMDSWRFVFNSTVGVLGVFDVAKHLGLPKHQQDFGLTMAKWGIKQSPYLLIPFLGPGTIRDQFASLVDYQALSIWPYTDPKTLRYSAYGLHLVNERAALLPADKLIDQAFDPYIFVRDAYLQKRNRQINQLLNKTRSQDDEPLRAPGVNVSNDGPDLPSTTVDKP